MYRVVKCLTGIYDVEPIRLTMGNVVNANRSHIVSAVMWYRKVAAARQYRSLVTYPRPD